MNRLLKIEWLKLKNYRVFIIIFSFFTLGVLTANYIVYSVFDNMINESSAKLLIGKFFPYDFTHTWQTTSYTAGYLLILPVLLIITLVTNEFTFKTSRQNVIDGLSRLQFIHTKMMLAFLLALFSSFLVIVTAFLFGWFSGSDFSLNGFSHVGFFFLKALSYNLLAVFLSVWIRKTGFVVGVYFIYLGAENIISQLLDLWSIKINKNYGFDLGSLGDYLPMNASDGLLTFPENPIRAIAKGTMPTDYFWVVIIFVAIYLWMFYWLGKRNVVNKDL